MELGELISKAQQLTQDAGLAYNLGEKEKAAKCLVELEHEIFVNLEKPAEKVEQEPAEPEEPEEKTDEAPEDSGGAEPTQEESPGNQED